MYIPKANHGERTRLVTLHATIHTDGNIASPDQRAAEVLANKQCTEEWLSSPKPQRERSSLTRSIASDLNRWPT